MSIDLLVTKLSWFDNLEGITSELKEIGVIVLYDQKVYWDRTKSRSIDDLVDSFEGYPIDIEAFLVSVNNILEKRKK